MSCVNSVGGGIDIENMFLKLCLLLKCDPMLSTEAVWIAENKSESSSTLGPTFGTIPRILRGLIKMGPDPINTKY